MNKKKIINDPVYGFIKIPGSLAFDIIEHRYFQRLRRIKQLGLTNLVYPGANHTRFQHTLGAMYLMGLAIDVLRSKAIDISDDEAEAVTLAILLHDIGHGPFSHTLETSILPEIDHEVMSELYMEKLNEEYNGQLSMAIEIFRNQYSKKFLHQLVSSQLDMDRLDYLRRDSFFSGVTEGAIGSDRIIKMLNVVDDKLVVEIKGIYSIEKFLIARRLMYWQVYLHKTVLASEQMLINILTRARELVLKGHPLFTTPTLLHFLQSSYTLSDIRNNLQVRDILLENFSKLDDNDIITSVKIWETDPDKVLSRLSSDFINRKLLKIEFFETQVTSEYLTKIKTNLLEKLRISEEEADFFIQTGSISNNAYTALDDRIRILYNDGTLKDISEASDMLNLSVLSKEVKKYFICYPKF